MVFLESFPIPIRQFLKTPQLVGYPIDCVQMPESLLLLFCLDYDIPRFIDYGVL